MLPWLGPTVASWPYLLRVAAYTGIWTCHVLLFQLIVYVQLEALLRAGLLAKDGQDKRPSIGVLTMIAANVSCWAAQSAGIGVVVAWFNPTPSSWTMASGPLDMLTHWTYLLAWQYVVFFAMDAAYYYLHSSMHKYKWIYRYCHKMHHDQSAMMGVLTAGWMDPLDGGLLGFMFHMAVAYAGCFWFRSYYFYALPLHTCFLQQLFGHCGYKLYNASPGTWTFVLLSPLVMAKTGNAMQAFDHSTHHHNSSTNFSLYCTLLDDLHGTAKPARSPHPVAAMLVDIAFVMVTNHCFTVAVNHPLTTLGATLLLWLVPGAVQYNMWRPFSCLMSQLGVWDRVRSAYRVRYAPAGSPGAFVADPQQRYIFCYHPQNILARGAWHTFAAVGKQSPAAALRSCRLVVAPVLFKLPWAGFYFRAMGCLPTSWQEMVTALTDKQVATSVALTPDGFAQAKYQGTYKLVLNRRRRFIKLAHETGALLVPVLGIGEPDLTIGCYNPGAEVTMLLTPARAEEIKVVFGEPLAVQAGEREEVTHSRYVAALLALGKQHGVELEIME